LVVGEDGNYTLEATVSNELISQMPGGLPQFERGFNISSGNDRPTADFTIHEISITKIKLCDLG
jgi:hypothetical protein